MTHTKEPWAKSYTSIIDADGLTILEMLDDGYTYAECESNAARIVECVNACAGLNPAAIPDVVEALKLALEYWGHRQRRYKNRSPVWVQDARQALSDLQVQS